MAHMASYDTYSTYDTYRAYGTWRYTGQEAFMRIYWPKSAHLKHASSYGTYGEYDIILYICYI